MKDQLARAIKLKKFWLITSVLLGCTSLAGILLKIPPLIILAGISSIAGFVRAFYYHQEVRGLEISIQLEPIISWFFRPAETKEKTGSGEKVEDPKEK